MSVAPERPRLRQHLVFLGVLLGLVLGCCVGSGVPELRLQEGTASLQGGGLPLRLLLGALLVLGRLLLRLGLVCCLLRREEHAKVSSQYPDQAEHSNVCMRRTWQCLCDSGMNLQSAGSRTNALVHLNCSFNAHIPIIVPTCCYRSSQQGGFQLRAVHERPDATDWLCRSAPRHALTDIGAVVRRMYLGVSLVTGGLDDGAAGSRQLQVLVVDRNGSDHLVPHALCHVQRSHPAPQGPT